MQDLEDALYDFFAADDVLLTLLEGPAEERVLAVRPPVSEVFPCITFDTVGAPAFTPANPISDDTVSLDVAARSRSTMNAIAARLVDQLDVVHCRRADQRAFTVPGRKVKFQGFVDREGTNIYEPTPRDVFHKVLSFRVITTNA